MARGLGYIAGMSTRVALFDLDGTLTWRDTLQSFLLGYLIRRPTRWLRLWRLLPAAASFVLDRDRGLLKSRVIRAALGGDSRRNVDAWADEFVAGLQARGTFRPAALTVLEAHRAAGDHLVLLSASPDLYVPRIGRLLGFERTLCTEIKWSNAGGGWPPRRRAADFQPARCGEVPLSGDAADAVPWAAGDRLWQQQVGSAASGAGRRRASGQRRPRRPSQGPRVRCAGGRMALGSRLQAPGSRL